MISLPPGVYLEIESIPAASSGNQMDKFDFFINGAITPLLNITVGYQAWPFRSFPDCMLKVHLCTLAASFFRGCLFGPLVPALFAHNAPLHTYSVLPLLGLATRSNIVCSQCTGIHSPHPPPWHGHSYNNEQTIRDRVAKGGPADGSSLPLRMERSSEPRHSGAG